MTKRAWFSGPRLPTRARSGGLSDASIAFRTRLLFLRRKFAENRRTKRRDAARGRAIQVDLRLDPNSGCGDMP